MADWNPYPDELRMDRGDEAAETLASMRGIIDQLEQAFKDDDVDQALAIMQGMNEATLISFMALHSLKHQRQDWLRQYRTQN